MLAAHRVLIRIRPAFGFDGAGMVLLTEGGPGRGAAYALEIRAQAGEIKRARVSQGPMERSPTLRSVQTGKHRMHPRTPADRPVTGVGNGGRLPTGPGHDHSQQGGPAITLTAAHTGTHRLLAKPNVASGSSERITGPGQSSAPDA